MALVKCNECGTEVSSKAKTCPKCGIRNPAKSKGCLYYIICIFLSLILLTFFIGMFNTRGGSSQIQSFSQSHNKQNCINEMFFNAAPGVTDRYEMRKEIYDYCEAAANNYIDEERKTSEHSTLPHSFYAIPCYLDKEMNMVWDGGLTFNQYKTPNIYKGKVARPDVNTNADARMYRTKLREGVKDSPNFAAKYTIVTWGCGMSCSAIAVVDAVSGQVFFSKNLVLVVGDKTSNDRFSFKQDSNLLIVAGRLNDDVGNPSLTYFMWDGNEFNLAAQHIFSESDCK